jgi:hypothetical protein
MPGLVPGISLIEAVPLRIGMAGTSPAMTSLISTYAGATFRLET